MLLGEFGLGRKGGAVIIADDDRAPDRGEHDISQIASKLRPRIFNSQSRHVRHVRLHTVYFDRPRSEEHTSELQSLMRKSYADFCLKKKTQTHITYDILTV